MDVPNLKEYKAYKESKVYCEHLEAIIKVINLSIQALKLFKVYIPVAKILKEMEEQKRLLDMHLEKQKKIKDTKGKVS